jgi:hypothetical protein
MELARALLEAIRDERDHLKRTGLIPDLRLSESLDRIAQNATSMLNEE